MEHRNSASELVRRGDQLAYRNQFQEAVDAYKLALDIAPSPEAHFGLGTVYLKQFRFAEAKNNFESSLTLNPGHAQALNSLGIVNEKLGYSERALKIYRSGVERHPGNYMLRNNLAALLYTRGLCTEAELELRKATAIKLTPLINENVQVLAKQQCQSPSTTK